MVDWRGFTYYQEGDCLNFNFDVNVQFSHEVKIDQPRFNAILKSLVKDLIKSYISNVLGDVINGDAKVL